MIILFSIALSDTFRGFCCGVLEHFNIELDIKPLFSFDEWMKRYYTPIDQEGNI